MMIKNFSFLTKCFCLLFFVTSGWSSATSVSFDSLVSHWNFNEGRDWHDHAFPHVNHSPVAKDWVGENDLDMSGRDSSAWISGRQLSGVHFTGEVASVLPFKRALSDEFSSDFTVTFWVRTSASGQGEWDLCPGLLGQAGGLEVGVLTAEGKIALGYAGQRVLVSSQPMNDGQWHQIAFTRDGASQELRLYVDGRLSGQAVLPSPSTVGSISQLGQVTGKSAVFLGDLDELSIFSQVLNEESLKVLRENHAPKAYGQETLVKAGQAQRTGSVLHRFSFDPDQDPISVVRFGQGAHGSVSYNGDGTFEYTGQAGFKTEDKFFVDVTDSKGGFARTYMTILEERFPQSLPVTNYEGFEELPLGEGVVESRTFDNNRTVKWRDWDGDGLVDLIAGGSSSMPGSLTTIFLYKNVGTPTEPKFAASVPLYDAGGVTPIAGAVFSFADINGDNEDELIVKSGSALSVYTLTRVEGGTRAQKGANLLTASGSTLNITSGYFDLGDVDGDGLLDLVVGDHSGRSGIFYYKNVGTAQNPRFETPALDLVTGSYNFSGHFADLCGTGSKSLIRGENWGGLYYYLRGKKGMITGGVQGAFGLKDSTGSTPMAKNYGLATNENTVLRSFDGTHSDFMDINGDGQPDMVITGYTTPRLFVAYGVNPKSAVHNLRKIEALYDAHLPDLGTALAAEDGKLLEEYKALMREWIFYALAVPTVAEKEAAYQDLKAHVKKYDFLQRKTLDAWRGANAPGPMHHVPGIFTQNWLTLFLLKPDSQAHREDVADAVGLVAGSADREQFLSSGLAVADNAKCSEGQYLSIKDFMKYHPRVLFPDDHISIDQHFGDGRNAMTYVFNSNKNTFGNDVGVAACEWANDLALAARKAFGPNAVTGCYFTFVMGHEVTHSLDGYVGRCVNTDIRRRWGENLVFAGNNSGRTSLLASGGDGWLNMAATKTNFLNAGLWDGVDANWDAAWNTYWSSGAGAAYNTLSSMRLEIKFFLTSPQESLATQANHHWSGSEGRLVGAIDRFYRGYTCNINEVLLFLDMQSAGLNKIPMYNIVPQTSPVRRAVFNVDYAWLERNDKGYIEKVTIEDRVYAFSLDERGKVMGITQSILAVGEDVYSVAPGCYRRLTPLLNDSSFLGGEISLKRMETPKLGSVLQTKGGEYFYKAPDTPVFEEDLSYEVTSDKGEHGVGTIKMRAGNGRVEMCTWTGISGSTVSNLTSSAAYQNNAPNQTAYLSSFEAPANRGDDYGARFRAVVIVPESGTYNFYIASDDASELYVSTTGKAVDKVRACSVSGYVSNKSWLTQSSQKSSDYVLTKGQRVYLEALHKEGGGGDHCAVGWKTPSQSSIAVIPASVLAADFLPTDFEAVPSSLKTMKQGESLSVDLRTLFAPVSGEGTLTPYLVSESSEGVTESRFEGETWHIQGLTLGRNLVRLFVETRFDAVVENTQEIFVGDTMPEPGSYESWLAEHGLGEGEGGLDSNPAGDGISNLMKYALGLNPKVQASIEPELKTVLEPEGEYMTLSYPRDPAATEVDFVMESSVDAQTWSEEPAENLFLQEGKVFFKDKMPMKQELKKFYRLKVKSRSSAP